MKIRIYSIAKKQNNYNDYMKEMRQFGVKLEIIDIFNANIASAQKSGSLNAKIAYSNEFEKYINKNTLNIALHPNGDELDSAEFSNLIKDKNKISFFIGGAFGFEEKFLQKMKNISLSKLTFSHKIAKIVLCEQIFRALCIINNHPYHKE